MSRRTGSYAAALEWIVQNDDIEFLSDPDGIESVSLCLVADVFGRTLVEAMADLRRLVKRLEREEVAS